MSIASVALIKGDASALMLLKQPSRSSLQRASRLG